jgi:glucokinase
VIGLLDIGGTKLAAGVADGAPTTTRVGAVLRVPTPPDDPVTALSDLLQRVSRGSRLDAIGVSAPGPFDRERGTLLDPPGMPPAWHGLQLAGELGARLGCRVLVENDANCAALAEALHGAGHGARTVVYFTVSTGIGTGIVRDGRLLIGRHDSEGGHQVLWPEWAGGPPCHCGGHGCLETLASGLAIERRYGVRAEHLDDPEAWAEVGRWIGLGVVNATALYDPDAVIFGGGVCASWDRFAPALMATVASHLFLQPAPRIVRGSLGEERSLVGALEVVRAAMPEPLGYRRAR